MITKVFEYNQHFVAMMNIINAAKLNPPKEGNKHHKHTKATKKLISQNVRNYIADHPEFKVHSKAHKDKIKAYITRRTAAWDNYNGSMSYRQFIK